MEHVEEVATRVLVEAKVAGVVVHDAVEQGIDIRLVQDGGKTPISNLLLSFPCVSSSLSWARIFYRIWF